MWPRLFVLIFAPDSVLAGGVELAGQDFTPIFQKIVAETTFLALPTQTQSMTQEQGRP